MAHSRVLLVEDEQIIAMEIEAILESLGYIVVNKAASGLNAILETKKQNPDIILMDIKIEGNLDGIETAQKIKEFSDVPVVFLTAYSDEATVERAKKEVPFGYLLKPFSEKELKTTIELAIYKHKIDKELKNTNLWLTTILHSIKDGVICTDDDERVTFINPEAENLTGFIKEVALGKNFFEICFLIELDLQENRIQKRAHTHLLKQNKTDLVVPVVYSKNEIRTQDNKIMGSLIILRNVSDQVNVAKNQSLKEFEFILNYLNRFQKNNEILQSEVFGKLSSNQRTMLEMLSRDSTFLFHQVYRKKCQLLLEDVDFNIGYEISLLSLKETVEKVLISLNPEILDKNLQVKIFNAVGKIKLKLNSDLFFYLLYTLVEAIILMSKENSRMEILVEKINNKNFSVTFETSHKIDLTLEEIPYYSLIAKIVEQFKWNLLEEKKEGEKYRLLLLCKKTVS